MTQRGILAGLVLAAGLAGCNRTPEPEPVAVTVTPAEEACAAQAAVASGVDAGTVSVVPVSSTKTAATVYEVTAGEARYSCVVETDLAISAFSPA